MRRIAETGCSGSPGLPAGAGAACGRRRTGTCWKASAGSKRGVAGAGSLSVGSAGLVGGGSSDSGPGGSISPARALRQAETHWRRRSCGSSRYGAEISVATRSGWSSRNARSSGSQRSMKRRMPPLTALSPKPLCSSRARIFAKASRQTGTVSPRSVTIHSTPRGPVRARSGRRPLREGGHCHRARADVGSDGGTDLPRVGVFGTCQVGQAVAHLFRRGGVGGVGDGQL